MKVLVKNYTRDMENKRYTQFYDINSYENIWINSHTVCYNRAI